jgi:hypothetical protein
VATFTQLASGNWRVQVRRKTRYVAETFRRRKDGEEWAFEMECNIDRNGSSKPRAVRNVRTSGDLIDLHDEDVHEVGRPPRRSKAAVMASLTEAAFRAVRRWCPSTERPSPAMPSLSFSARAELRSRSRLQMSSPTSSSSRDQGIISNYRRWLR